METYKNADDSLLDHLVFILKSEVYTANATTVKWWVDGCLRLQLEVKVMRVEVMNSDVSVFSSTAVAVDRGGEKLIFEVGLYDKVVILTRWRKTSSLTGWAKG